MIAAIVYTTVIGALWTGMFGVLAYATVRG